MYALDFEYDNKNLSDFGFIICDFNFDFGAKTTALGAEIEFTTVPHSRGKRHSLISADYTERIEASFDICKNPSTNENRRITNDEFRTLVRWLNRREFCPFRIINERNDICYFNASFNISRVTVADKLYGLHLEMVTDSPFGHGATRTIRLDFSGATNSNPITRTMIDYSDEIGYIYPSITINCKSAGNLSLANSMTGCNLYIEGCTNNEEIHIDEKTLAVTTNNSEHDILNCFNYNYFSIGNSLDNRINKITSTLSCVLTIVYRPIIKDIPW